MDIINGVGDNLFNPGGNTSREEAIVLAKRMNDKVLTSRNNLVVSRAGTSRRESWDLCTERRSRIWRCGKEYNIYAGILCKNLLYI